MEPRIVKQAPRPPGQCLFSQDIDGPWIDLGIVAPWVRPHGYLSVKYVEGLARDLLEMIPAETALDEIRKLQVQVRESQEKCKALEKFIAAQEELEEAMA